MCIFCMLALTLMTASLNAVMLGSIETRLRKVAKGVQRSVDTESTIVWKGTVELKSSGGQKKQIPVAIHLYKLHKRARVQILTHEITQEEAETAENLICKALEARIISRHFPKHDDHSNNTSAQPVMLKRNTTKTETKSDLMLKRSRRKANQDKPSN